MPIQLTTPFNPGEIADDGPYTLFKINQFTINVGGTVLNVAGAFGNVVDGKFVVGQAKGARRTYAISGDDYVTLCGKTASAAGVVLYDEVAKELYIHMQASDSRLAGTLI